jgi:hypothetical protein
LRATVWVVGSLSMGTVAACAPVGMLPYAAGGAYYAASAANTRPAAPPPTYPRTSYPSPAYQPPPSAPAPPVQTVAIFDPPPGPITDSCGPPLERRLAARQAILNQQPADPALIKRADEGVRAVWAACQDKYLEERMPKDAPPPWADPWAPAPSAAGAPSVQEAAVAASEAPPPEEPAAPQVEPPEQQQPPEQAPAEQPRPVKLSPAQRKAAAEREAKRKEELAKKKAEKAERRRQAAEAAEAAARAYCGSQPDRSAWDGTYDGLPRFFERSAHDPDSVDFDGCTPIKLKGAPTCWVTICNVRAKNAFGAKVLSTYAFGKSSRGWKVLAQE